MYTATFSNCNSLYQIGAYILNARKTCTVSKKEVKNVGLIIGESVAVYAERRLGRKLPKRQQANTATSSSYSSDVTDSDSQSEKVTNSDNVIFSSDSSDSVS